MYSTLQLQLFVADVEKPQPIKIEIKINWILIVYIIIQHIYFFIGWWQIPGLWNSWF